MDAQNTILQNWKIVKKIGKGSFGTVYEIERELPGKLEKAALKIITIPQSQEEIEELYREGYSQESIIHHYQDCLQQIVKEYSIMAEIKGHTNIVDCDDICYEPHENGTGWDIYIRMELLTPMTEVLHDDIDEKEVMKIGMDLCRALQLCENRSILHRDIKPQNVFVSKDGDYKLGDFGIATITDSTVQGTKVGTYKYMSPEVYHGQPYGRSSDIYSLGLLLYWLLNERCMPFASDYSKIPTAEEEEQMRMKRFNGEPFPLPKNGSNGLKQIVLKACAYDPDDRYVSAGEMLEDLQKLYYRKQSSINQNADDEEGTVGLWKKPNDKGVKTEIKEDEKLPVTPQEPPVTPPEPEPALKQKNLKLIILVAVIAAIIIAVVVFLILPKTRKKEDDLTQQESTEVTTQQATEEEMSQPGSEELMSQQKLEAVYHEYMDNGWPELQVDYKKAVFNDMEPALQAAGWTTTNVQNTEENDQILKAVKEVNGISYEILIWKWKAGYSVHFNVKSESNPTVSDNQTALQGIAPDSVVQTLGIKTFDELITPSASEQIKETEITEIDWVENGETTKKNEYWYNWQTDTEKWSYSWYTGNAGQMYYHIGPADNHNLDVGFLQENNIRSVIMSF